MSGKKACWVLARFPTDPERLDVVKLAGVDVFSGSCESLLCLLVLFGLVSSAYVLEA